MSSICIYPGKSVAGFSKPIRLLSRVFLSAWVLSLLSCAAPKQEQKPAPQEIKQAGGGQKVTGHGIRIFQRTTLPEFAKFIGAMLNAPVADQTALPGTWYIAVTTPQIGQTNGSLERLSGVLLNELGLQLVPYAGPFTNNEETFARDNNMVRRHNGTNVIPPIAVGPGLALRFDYANAPGLRRVPQASPGTEAHADAVAPPEDQGARNFCINCLRLIDAAKMQWALDHNEGNADAPTWDDLRDYLGRGTNRNMPFCPDKGTYTVGAIGEKPTCSIPGHILP